MMSIFLYPTLWLFLMLGVGVLSLMLMRRYRWQKRGAQLLGKGLRNFSIRRKFLRIILLVGSLICLACALSRPQWGQVTQTVSQEGRDVLVALDISRSMLAQDVAPSRIELAKKKIQKLLSHLTAERASLLVFSGVAMVQCPFTSDMHAFLNFLDLADVESTSSGTTVLGNALSKAIETFDTVPSKSSRILIMVTDGEDFSTDLVDIEAKAQARGIHIFTMGVGTIEGGPIPLYDAQGIPQGHQKDEQGNVVITRLNEALLKQLAHKTGGLYIPMTSADNDIAAIVKAVQRFEKNKFDDKTFMHKEEHYAYFALAAMILLLIEWIL